MTVLCETSYKFLASVLSELTIENFGGISPDISAKALTPALSSALSNQKDAI